MLTQKQYELLVFVDSYLKDNGVSPSFDEMKDALGLKSKSGIHRLITGLEEREYIFRRPNRARALEVRRLPDNARLAGHRPSRPAKGLVERFGAKVIEGGLADRAATTAQVVELPLYGRIAAGTPVEALRDTDEFVEVPAYLLGGGEHYALKVEGESMINAGILDGDTVVIQHGDVADNGAIVVALVDATEVTLKRLRRKSNSIALEAANPDYETRDFGPDRVKVQGRLVGLIRKY
jgi:repressor LexA